MQINPKISIVLAGPHNNEFDLYYSVQSMRNIFPESELILSTNDKTLISKYEKLDIFNKIITCPDCGELPSLKFPLPKQKNNIYNNINKQITSSLLGIQAASNDLVLKIRTDQVLLNREIVNLWNTIKEVPILNKTNKGRIITSSIFSINPRYSERMPFHVSDMLQFGYKNDLIRYYSAPEYPFNYAIWYETHSHAHHSNHYEKMFRSKYAVEQWLALHYIYKKENKFPIRFHNDLYSEVISEFEKIIPDYFIIAHPDDIGLRASKFEPARSYYNTQCYSTHESINMLNDIIQEEYIIKNRYPPKGINKKLYSRIKIILDISAIQVIIKIMPRNIKNYLKKIIS